jgi:hypothetical protein
LFLDELGAFDKASPNFLRRALNLVKRTLRFLFALEPESINLNLNLIDSYIQLQTLLENAEKRPPQGPTTTDDDATDNTLPHVSGNQTHRKKAVSRQPTKQKIVDQQFQPAGVRSRITRRATMAEMFLESSGSNSGRQTKRVATLTDSQRRPDANPDVVEVKVEDIADAIFGSLHCTKMQLKKYTNGKVSQEDLLLRNNETLRRLFRFLLANRLGTKVGTSFKAPATPSVSFEALRDQYPSYLSKLCYSLHIDGFMLMYVPATKHKQVLHLEVKGENHESMHTSGTSSGTLNASSSGSGSGVSKFIWVRVQMMSNEQESGLFVLRPGVTLDSLMSWLTDKSNWSDLASDSSSKSLTSRKLFGSTKGTTTRNVNSPIKLVDPPSKQFWSELGRLASFATGITTGSGTRVSERGHSSHRKDKEKERERSRSRGGDEPPTEADLCFAAKVQIGDSIPQFTLITQDKMKIPVTQAFPHILEEGENVDTKPLQVCILSDHFPLLFRSE